MLVLPFLVPWALGLVRLLGVVGVGVGDGGFGWFGLLLLGWVVGEFGFWLGVGKVGWFSVVLVWIIGVAGVVLAVWWWFMVVVLVSGVFRLGSSVVFGCLYLVF